MSELYLFNNNNVLRGFVASIFPVTFDGTIYYPTVITRSALNLTENFEKSEIEFQFARDHSFALDLLQNIPEAPIRVTIYRNSAPYWHGEVKSCKSTGKTINVVCNNLDSSLTKHGLRARMTLQCRKVLYSADCGVVQNLWRSEYSVTRADSNEIFISGLTQPEGYFSGGVAILQEQNRRIIVQTTTTIKLTHPFTGVLSGTIELYPGCTLTKDACLAFNNLDNGGMFPDIPSKNPFSATGLL